MTNLERSTMNMKEEGYQSRTGYKSKEHLQYLVCHLDTPTISHVVDADAYRGIHVILFTGERLSEDCILGYGNSEEEAWKNAVIN